MKKKPQKHPETKVGDYSLPNGDKPTRSAPCALQKLILRTPVSSTEKGKVLHLQRLLRVNPTAGKGGVEVINPAKKQLKLLPTVTCGLTLDLIEEQRSPLVRCFKLGH